MELVDTSITRKRKEQRRHFAHVLVSLRYLARQGIALRDHDYVDDNLTQLMMLLGRGDENVQELLMKNNGEIKKYTHSDFQNEVLDLMAKEVLSNLLTDIRKSPFYAIMADEYTDVQNNEQLSFCVRLD